MPVGQRSQLTELALERRNRCQPPLATDSEDLELAAAERVPECRKPARPLPRRRARARRELGPLVGDRLDRAVRFDAQKITSQKR
jgi:hypothetical protein